MEPEIASRWIIRSGMRAYALACRQVSVLVLCFIMKLDEIVRMMDSDSKFSKP